MTPRILKGFDPEFYFTRAALNEKQKLQLEIASIFYSSADEATKERLEKTSDRAVLELSKIEKRKSVLAKIKSEMKKRGLNVKGRK